MMNTYNMQAGNCIIACLSKRWVLIMVVQRVYLSSGQKIKSEVQCDTSGSFNPTEGVNKLS